MFLIVFGVFQFILIQVISVQLSARDLLSQNVLMNLANTPLAGYGRSRRQVNNLPDLTDNLPVNGFASGLPFKNGMSFDNFAQGSGTPSNFGLNDGLTSSALKSELPNNLPISSSNFPFPNLNILPQNRPLPKINFNGIINNGLPFNNIPTGLPGLNNIPNRKPGFNNVPTGLPAFNNIPNFNGIPGLNKVPNGLPSFNNIPNEIPGFNKIPNGLPSFNNNPNGIPGLNKVPNGFPSFNNIPNRIPGLNNVPNRLPGFNNGPNGLPSLNNLPNGLPNFNSLPVTNKFQNLINVPAGSNILNLNSFPAANSLRNMNNVPIPNSMPSFNNLPCDSALPSLPSINGLPPNNLPSGNILPPINNILPFLNNFRITEIGIGKGLADVNRFPRDDQQYVNMSPTANNLQNFNGFSGILNTPSACEVSNNDSANRFPSVNNFPNDNDVSYFAGEAQNVNTMQLNNAMPDVSNFQNYDVMPVNEQRFISHVALNNDFAIANNFPANTAIPNANSRLVNVIHNGMPLSSGGYLNDISFANNAANIQETHVHKSDGNTFSGNDVQFVNNMQMPVSNGPYDFLGTNTPANHNLLSEGVQMFSNVPNDCQSGLTPNNLSVAQELVKNFQIEGLANMPFLNGLPVAGITETVTVLNGPYRN